jgi:YggT family protein
MNRAVYDTISLVFTIIEFAVLARVIISWIPVQKENKLIAFLYLVTEPILAPIRGMIERSSFGKNMMFDISPIIALLLIYLVRSIVLGIFRF